jgi:hypothetical protein
MKLHTTPKVKIATVHDLGRRWDDKLSQSAKNPFPLAPRDLVRKGLVTPENYARENEKLGRFRNSVMRGELERIRATPAIVQMVAPEIKVFGVGLGRDMLWVGDALHLGFSVSVCDVSNVACQKLPKQEGLRVYNKEIEDGWADLEMDSPKALVYCALQFIQILDRDKMYRVMRRLGYLLRVRQVAGQNRILYVAHPFHKDNKKVEWGDTTPYSKEEFMIALGVSVEMELLGVHKYFHQSYSFFKIQQLMR